jgi:prepilin-type N-terminal cleavage/methylation domain-containing protein
MFNTKYMPAPESIKSQVSSVKKKSGFTLIELMVSIAIIAILAAVGLVVYSTAQKAARISKRAQDLDALKTAMELYKATNGSYPNQSNATPTCTLSNASTALGALVPTYMPQIPTDPSGGATNCYLLQTEAATLSQQFKIRTSNTEMVEADYVSIPSLVDPARDEDGSTVNCVINVTPSANNVTAWAVYSGAAACAY